MNLYIIARDALLLRQECIYYTAVNDRKRAQECGLQALSKYLDLAEILKSQKPEAIPKDVVSYYAKQAKLTLEIVERIKAEKNILTKENAVVWRSSALPGGRFYPWMGDPPIYGSEHLWNLNNTYKEDISSDKTTELLRLSLQQMSLLSGWKSISELNPEQTMWPEDYDLLQGASMDCPLVASLITCLNYENLQNEKLVTNILYPQDDKHNSVLSPVGFYDIKILYNGRTRLVRINDKLPVLDIERSGNRTLYLRSESQPCRFGPTLIEKALLKVFGEGYDFGGSNIATVTYALCGFIPEVLLLQSSLQYLEQLWDSLFGAWKAGNALIGAGTGKHIVEMDLTPEHDYAVVDMKEEQDGTRMVLFMDPAKSFGDSGKRFKWFNLREIGRYFSCLYVNWNPEMLPFSQSSHFEVMSTNMNGFHNLESAQFIVRSESKTKSVIWFLLVRHLTEKTSAINESPAIGICFHKSSCHSVMGCQRPVMDLVYMNTQQIFSKLTVDPETDYTVVPIVKYKDGNKSRASMSLFAFSGDNFTLQPATPLLRYCFKLSGRSTTISFSPSDWLGSSQQFGLKLERTSKVAVILECDENCDPNDDSGLVQLKLAWAQSLGPKGKANRIQTLPKKGLIISSGDYRRNHCIMSTKEHDLEPGNYVIIISRFYREGQHEKNEVRFSLIARADNCQPVMYPLADYASGRFTREVSSTWEQGRSERQFGLKIDRKTNVTISLASEPSYAQEHIEICLMAVNGMGIIGKARQPSGMRCTINDVHLHPNMSTEYIIVCKRDGRISTEVRESFLLAIHSEEAIQILQEI